MFDGIKVFTMRMIAGANVATILLMMGSGYSDYLSPERFSLLSNVGLLFPLFLVANLCFLFFWLLFKAKYAMIPFVGFVLCYGPVRRYMPINMDEEIPRGAIKVLSYNTLNLGHDEADENSINPILAYVQKQNADIVCLQEASPTTSDMEQIDTLLHAQYPYVDVLKHPNGGNALMLLSKFPILSSELIPYQSKGNMSAAYQLEINHRKVLVINNHLETTGLSLEERREFKNLVKGNLQTHSAEKTSKLLIVKLAESTKKRAPEARAVARYVRQHRGQSIILCGDFNDGPISYAHRTIAQGLTDCYVASGNGPGISYHRSGFFVRIDNIMCSKEWKPYRCYVDDKIAISDHYPILCYLKMGDNH